MVNFECCLSSEVPLRCANPSVLTGGFSWLELNLKTQSI